MANPPTRRKLASGKSSATSATRTRSAPKPDMAPPVVNTPVAASAASIVAPPGAAPRGGIYSPGGAREEAAAAAATMQQRASESPLAHMSAGESEFETGGEGHHAPGPAPNPRHPTERFDHDDDLSADQRIAALAEIDDDHGEETLEQAITRIAAMRKPLGAFHQKLAIDKRPDYHTHWFNDEGNRIAEAVEAGWEFRKKNGKTIRRAVGTGRDKGVLWAYAMDIPSFFWRQDMDARHQFAQERMDAIQKAPVMSQGRADRADQGKFYSPSEMLTVEKRN